MFSMALNVQVRFVINWPPGCEYGSQDYGSERNIYGSTTLLATFLDSTNVYVRILVANTHLSLLISNSFLTYHIVAYHIVDEI
jgi:hypothetical protein